MMPFRPTNGPATFVSFIYDMDSVWKKLATSRGIQIGDTTNTWIIIDDIVSWLSLEDYALEYIRCQLKVCQAYHLSLNLHKSHFFPERFKFIGIDVCANGNWPAKSKHNLLLTWPGPEFVRNMAKFIGFCQFYSCFIHHFELHIAPLRKLTKHEYTNPIEPLWTDAAHAVWEDMRTAIVSDPCLKCLIIASWWCLGPTSPLWGSVTCSSSKETMMRQFEQHRIIGMARFSCS